MARIQKDKWRLEVSRIYFFVILFFLGNVHAGTNKEAEEKLREYFQSKTHVVLGVKVSGALSYVEFSDYFEEDGDVSRDYIKFLWSKYEKKSINQVLILKIYKGLKSDLENDILTYETDNLAAGVGIGNKAIFFMAEKEGALKLEVCDYASIEELDGKKAQLLLGKNSKQLIDFLIQNNLFACFDQELPSERPARTSEGRTKLTH